MTGPGKPQEPTSRDRSSTGQAVQDQAAPAEPSPTALTSDIAPPPTTAEAPPAPVADEQVGVESPQRGGMKGRLAALGAGVASLAKRVYKGGPKKMRLARRGRTTNRCVILTEVGGRLVAIGPYRNEQAAHKDLARTHGQQVVELTAAKHLAASDGGSPSAQR
jgi:hypothetical protein